MVKFGPTSVEEAMPLAERAADEVLLKSRFSIMCLSLTNFSIFDSKGVRNISEPH
jgi:hypothetical protein